MNTKPSKYQTYSYNPESGILFRTLTNKKHLLWRPPFRGMPAFNLEVIAKCNPKWIGWKMDGHRYYCSREVFDKFSVEINDVEPQQILEEYWWSER